MEAKHTPGPWKIDDNKELPLAVIQDDESGTGVCEIGTRGLPRNTAGVVQFADARLIAAAPNMFSRIEKFLNGPDALTWAGMKEAWELATGRKWEGPCPIGQNG